MNYLITYHNDNSGVAVWETEKYRFETSDPVKFDVMKETNELLRDPYHTISVAAGIRMMVEFDGERTAN